MLGGSPQPSSPGVKLVEDNPTGYDGLEALQPYCCDIRPGCVGQIKIGFVVTVSDLYLHFCSFDDLHNTKAPDIYVVPSHPAIAWCGTDAVDAAAKTLVSRCLMLDTLL